MAYQTEIDLPLKPWPNVFLLFQCVEDRSQSGIGGSKLQRAAPLHVPYVDVIIEIERARPAGRVWRELKTGLG